jgi:hypothetical protein
MKLELFRQVFEKSSNVKFHGKSSSRSRVVPCGRTDMKKLTGAFAILRKRLKYSGQNVTGRLHKGRFDVFVFSQILVL